MHLSIMESSSLPFANFSGQNVSEARSDLSGRQSAYMTNMILPDMVQSSKNFPLGPDCLITHSDVPDQSVLVNMDLYWFISLERGCVECKVLVKDTIVGRKAITHDARVIITRKPRRFEAYCCGVCRSNFVTVVQALLHMKAFHRQNKKILIQDQNVFHDIEKAMEVPPVPLPWYVAKRVTEQGIQIANLRSMGSTSDFETPTTANSSSLNDGEGNPVTSLLQAIVKEYGKQVHVVLFGKDFADVKVQFEDKTTIIAHLPDLVSEQTNEDKEIDPETKLEFQVQRVKSLPDEAESCVVRVNNPALAQRLIVSALKQGVAKGSGTDLVGQDEPSKDSEKPSTGKQDENSHVSSSTGEDKPLDSPLPQVKLSSRKRPVKTVRFMVGSPDSDEDCSSTASERAGGRDSVSPNTSNIEKDVTTTITSINSTGSPEKPSSTEDDKKPAKEDEGLQGVVNQLISTASKGIIAPVDPVSPAPTSTTNILTGGVREEILATAAYHARNLPKNLSVPNLSSSAVLTVPITSAVSTQPIAIRSAAELTKQGMIRVQSWGGGGNDLSQRFSLSTYTPNTPQSFDHLSREELRKSFVVGRPFTYAEKIRLMKKLNDEDSLLTQEHVRGTGKLIESEEKSRKASASSVSSITESLKPLSPTVTSTTTIGSKTKLKVSESDPTQGSSSNKRKIVVVEPQQPDRQKKRRSKYDVEKFMQNQGSEMDQLQFVNAGSKKHNMSSSDGSISDRDDENNTLESDDPPSLLDMMRNHFPAQLLTTQAAQPPSVSYPSMLSSEYYGSGEWASAAMQTLRNLQTSMKSAQAAEQIAVIAEQSNKETLAAEDSDSRSSSPFVDINTLKQSDTGATTSPKSSFVPLSSVVSSKVPSGVDTIMALAKQITAEQTHMKHLTQQPETSRSRSERKRSLSPLLTPGEKEIIRARANANDVSNKRIKKDKNAKISPKSASDKTKRRTPENKSFVIADKGDHLEFKEQATGASVKKNREITLKFCKNSSNISDDSGEASTGGHEQLFQNSIETVMKVKYIEKVNLCRVCGYSLPVNDNNNNNVAAMKSHVMEHSLKELIQAGCNGKT